MLPVSSKLTLTCKISGEPFKVDKRFLNIILNVETIMI